MSQDQQMDEDDLFERSLVESIHPSSIATVITSLRLPDNPVIAVNQAFSDLTGYSISEATGRNCRFLSGPDTEPDAQQILRGAIAEHRAALTELLNYKKDGTPFRNAVMIAPVRSPSGKVTHYIGSQMDATSQSFLPGGIKRQHAAGAVSALTPRQRQVLEQMIRGLRNKQIAAALDIDEKTVKMHRAGMLDRLGAPTSADAIRIGVEAGLG